MPKKHNILLIICDALRPDFLGCYTKAEANTPTIDNLAENSVLFQNAIAPGCGTPLSVPELLTSTYPSIHGDYFLTSPENKLSGLLQANGWDTAAISTNAYLSPIFGYNRGYNHFQYLSKRNEIYLLYYFYRRLIELKDALSKKGFSKLLEFLITLLPLPQVRPPYASAAEVTKKAITWLNKLSEPFFLWLHYMDPHGPYVPPLSSLLHTKRKRGEKRWKWIYRAEIQFLDANLGKLIQYLRSRDFWS
ncbi:MAG: sulfatase-like hydrolase/transferase, partial [Candidatus Korarchaeota archaeon]|nr:sulfatase-like hydrolase/transferase [Candidatus Korarchaeota archaeon]NIU82517.1 sulfatase-like hydrolase/transferase [Candidatus Thorarchaeota archaeon]NIW13004.1 sulfatase-like hydrolase/transferase [Candidatus Thorarchaeota archaeon]